MKLESNDFNNGEAIPEVFTCEGEGRSPSLKIADVPAEAKSLVLIMDDPDAPGGTWVHWLVWNGMHRYFFKLYALDKTLSLSSADVKQLEKAMKPFVIDQCELMGTYRKNQV